MLPSWLRARLRAVSIRWPRHCAVVLAGLFGVVASAAVFLMIGSWEYRVAVLDFENLAKDRLQSINHEFTRASGLLHQIAAYMQAADGVVNRPEFERFSQSLHVDVPELRDTVWAPRVELADRDRFERSVRASGFPGFQITENHQGRFIRAGIRLEYYPILYAEGGVHTHDLMGIDVIGDPEHKALALRSVESGQPAATPPESLPTIPQGGILSFLAVGPGVAGKLHTVPPFGVRCGGLLMVR